MSTADGFLACIGGPEHRHTVHRRLVRARSAGRFGRCISVEVALALFGTIGAPFACGADLEAPADASSQGQIQEVVVTAQKRSENQQDVPIAVSTVSGNQLEKLSVTSVSDLRVAVPSLNLTDTYGRLTMSLRGVGTSVVGPGIENPVALYIDGVYYASTTGSLLSLNNIRDVEVLKGPQGTLFGRNATAGLVQVTTRDPTQSLSASADVSYSNFQRATGSFYVAGGLTDNLAADLAVFALRQGQGWGTNLATGNELYNVDYDISVRSKWVFTPAEDTKLTFILDNTDIKDTMIGSAINGGTQSPFFPGVPQPDLGYDNNNNYDPVHSIRNRGASLRWDQQIAGLSFASTTAYRNARSVIAGDIDGLPQFFEQFYSDQLDQQFTQELQLTSDPTERLKWTAGVFYFDAKTGYEPFSVYLADAGIFYGVPRVYESSRSEAGYVQGTYDIFDQTNLTLGVRYTNETRREYDAYTSTYPLGADPSTAINTPIADESVKFDKVTYRASLDHRFSDEVMGYASFNTGFKSGGFNVPTPGAPAFLPESLKAYELGLKLDVLDRRVRFNVAAFYYDYKDIQVQKYVDVTIGTVNGGAAVSYGIDADLTAILAPGLQLTAGGTAANPHFTDFTGCARTTPTGGVPVVSGSCTGNMLNLASKGTASVALDYTFSLPAGEIDLNGNVYYNSGFYTESDNIIHQPSFAEGGCVGPVDRARGALPHWRVWQEPRRPACADVRRNSGDRHSARRIRGAADLRRDSRLQVLVRRPPVRGHPE